jgi:hypothetical protein
MLPRHLILSHNVDPKKVDELLPPTYKRRTRSGRILGGAEEAEADDPAEVQDAEEGAEADEPADDEAADENAGEEAQGAGDNDDMEVGDVDAPDVPADAGQIVDDQPADNQPAEADQPADADEPAADQPAVADEPVADQPAVADEPADEQPAAADEDEGEERPDPAVERGVWVGGQGRSTTSSGTYSPVLPSVFITARDVDEALRAAQLTARQTDQTKADNLAQAGPSGINRGVRQAAAAATDKGKTPVRKVVAKGKAPAVIR